MYLELVILLIVVNFVFGQCPPGLTPLFSNSNFNTPLTCLPTDPTSCYSNSNRMGTVCQYASQYSNYICCYSTNTQCGSNSSPQISAIGQTVTCSSNSQCSCGYSCNFGVCCPTSAPTCGQSSTITCLTGQVNVNGQCYNSVSIGAPCQNSQQCTGGSSCVNSICQCQNGYGNINQQCKLQNPSIGECFLGSIPFNQQCISLASPGQQCQSQATGQCIDNSFCSNGICTCPSNYNMVYGYCVPLPTGNCLNTQTFVNNMCVLFSIVGETCIANSQCVGGATCSLGTCQCSNGFTAMYGYCIRSSINCNSNQVMINNQCYNYVQIGGSCSFSQQCLNGGTCSNNVCVSTNCNIQCPTNQVCISNQCYNYVSVGSQCFSTQKCLSNSQCLNGFCQCPSGTQLTNGICTSSSTNFCSAGQTVQVDNSGQIINCLLSTCPSGSFCQYSQTGQRYVCCRSTNGKK